MAKSPTRKKSRVKRTLPPEQLAEVEQGVKQAVKYVNDWKKRELFQMAANVKKGTIPICIPVSKTSYVVGQYGIVKDGTTWAAVNSVDNVKNNFSRRASALVYTLCDQTGHKKLAKSILQHDTNVIKITEELESYTYKKDRASRKQDYWRVDHFYIMAASAEFRLSEAKHQLEKSIQLAKYFKIWD